LPPQEEPTAAKKKTFKDYEPGFIHVDVKYLPQMPDEPHRRYLFVAIDRATRWVYLELHKDKSAASSERFFKHLIKQCPVTIQKVLAENGKEFTHRFCATGERQPTGHHPMDKLCRDHGIEHRLIPTGHPQTHGMVERFNGRISEVLNSTRLDSSWDLEQTLKNYCRIYNQHIPQKALEHSPPIIAMKQWQLSHPHLFNKLAYNLAGP